MLYPVIPEPPSEVGAVQDSATEPLPAEASSPNGADGTAACGVAEASLDCGEVPTALTAATL